MLYQLTLKPHTMKLVSSQVGDSLFVKSVFVRAGTEKRARELANARASIDGQVDVWLSPAQTTCVPISPRGHDEVLYMDLHQASINV